MFQNPTAIGTDQVTVQEKKWTQLHPEQRSSERDDEQPYTFSG